MKNTPIIFLISLIAIKSINSAKFLQKYYGKNNCPNSRLTNLALLISFSEEEVSLFESTLTPEERTSYEEMVSMKRSFSTTMSYVPQSFSPEKESYWSDLNVLVAIFFYIATLPFICIIIYLIMRFVCNKCVGPQKLAKVNKLYRNITWVLMIFSSVAVTILCTIIIVKSVKVHNGMATALDFAAEEISKSESLYPKVNEVVTEFRKANLNVPSEEYMEELSKTIEVYIKNTKARTQQIIDDEKSREVYMLIIFIFVNIFTILAYLFFCFKFEKFERILAIVMLFVLPFMIVIEGYNAKFFFYYGDICDSVNGALYSNEIPVADQALGYYYNCLPLRTKASLYQIRYRLYDAAYNNKNENEDIISSYENVNTNTFVPLFNCETVSKVVPTIESEFCKDGLAEMYDILLLLTWLILAELVEAVATRRLEALIWKRKKEIESMLLNQEVLF